jgi:acetylglutamate kinase
LRLVIKVGGDVLAAPALAEVARDLAAVTREQPQPAARRLLLVHGGGPQATALSRRLGVEPRIIAGRRVTDPAALDVMKMVVAGQLNVDLVSALRAEGVPAVGLHGPSGVIRARLRPPRRVSGSDSDQLVDLGLVGDVEGFDLDLLRLLEGAGHVPVIACLGGSQQGQVLNINADVVASQLAVAVAANALVAVTAVGGVRRHKDDPLSRIGRLTVAEARAAIADGTVQGGMIPKLEEAFAPLAAGVNAVHIVGPGEIAACLRAPGSVGTMVVTA